MTAGDAHNLLILSDGKPGHLNQSLAFARLLGHESAVCRVAFPNRLAKAASYLLDRLGIHSERLFTLHDPLPAHCCAVVSAGSSTYYANRTLGRRLGVPSVAIMYPGGYASDGFRLVIAQEHDTPPARANILTLPINLCAPEPRGLVTRQAGNAPVIAVILGGSSRHHRMAPERVAAQLAEIFALFPGGDFLVTTSRRTPPEVERLVAAAPFRYRVIASREAVNPIADFLACADYVFVSEDSTSMLSEAVSFGAARVEVLPLEPRGGRNKVQGMIASLEAGGYLHRFAGSVGDCRRKLALKPLLEGRSPCA